MRKDEQGKSCPETLGEYRSICEAIGIKNNSAVRFLDKKIAQSPNGIGEKVLIPDSQMRAILLPMLVTTGDPWVTSKKVLTERSRSGE